MMYSRRAFLQSSFGAGLLGVAVSGFTHGRPESTLGARLATEGFRGDILVPASPRYEEARRMFVFNPRRPARPQLIAVCADEDDVRRAIVFAREHSLETSVRSGGHDMLAASICNGLVIDLSALQAIQIDRAARTVRVGAGVRAGTLNAALSQHGLAAVLGCAGSVGVAGLTLGGGLGWLVGRYGAACDHLMAARVVTTAGRVLRVSTEEHPDLLWALRGGGGNFGIVTELTLQLHPRPVVTQGMVVLRGDNIADFLRRHRDFLTSAGDHVDLETFILAPQGKPMVFIKACYSGAPARAERILAPLRRLGTVVADDLAPTRYSGLINPTGPIIPLFRPAAQPHDPDDAPGLHVGAVSMSLGDSPAEIIAEGIRRAEGSWFAGVAHYVHGAASRVSSRHSAMQRVDGLITSYFGASWRRSEHAERRMAWVDETVAALQPQAGPTYVNYMCSDDSATIRRAYGDAYPRLAAIKRRYDPDNFLRRNRNIRPA